MADMNDLLTLVPGAKVIVTGCEAREHGDNAGCLCSIKGTVHVMRHQYESFFAGTPTWWLGDTQKRVRLSEITFVKDPA